MESDCDESVNNTEYNEEEGPYVDESPIPEIKKANPFPHTSGTIWSQANALKYPKTSTGLRSILYIQVMTNGRMTWLIQDTLS